MQRTAGQVHGRMCTGPCTYLPYGAGGISVSHVQGPSTRTVVTWGTSVTRHLWLGSPRLLLHRSTGTPLLPYYCTACAPFVAAPTGAPVPTRPTKRRRPSEGVPQGPAQNPTIATHVCDSRDVGDQDRVRGPPALAVAQEHEPQQHRLPVVLGQQLQSNWNRWMDWTAAAQQLEQMDGLASSCRAIGTDGWIGQQLHSNWNRWMDWPAAAEQLEQMDGLDSSCTAIGTDGWIGQQLHSGWDTRTRMYVT